MSNENHKYIIEKVKCRLLINEPFFGHLLSCTNILPHENILKFQVYGNKIYYNPKYIESLSFDVALSQLLHCLMHIAFNHFVRRQNRNSSAWNISTDVAVNNILKYENNRNVDGITDNKFIGKSAENIYEKYKLDNNNGSGGYGPGQGSFDEHIDTNDIQAEQETMRYVVEAHAMARSVGKMPGGFETLISDILEPKLDWKEMLRKYATECFMNEDYSFTNPRKCLLPLGIYTASLMQEADTLSRLIIGIDTSGSVGDNELKEFFSEIKLLYHLAERTTIIQCDSVIHSVNTLNIFDALDSIKFKGRGGTDFRPVFELVEQNKMNPALMVFLTDSYGVFPEKKPSYPTIWCMTNSTYQKPPFGEVLVMNKDN